MVGVNFGSRLEPLRARPKTPLHAKISPVGIVVYSINSENTNIYIFTHTHIQTNFV